MHHIAVRIGQHLHLDMARLLEIFLHIDVGIAERRLGFRTGQAEGFLQLFRIAGMLHALAAAAGGGLDQHRIADAGGFLERLLLAVDTAGRTGHAGDADADRRLLGGDLVAHHANMIG